MRGTWATSPPVAACLSLLVGCAVFAGKQDYADYREIRLAGDRQTRLLAMQRYVAAHPDGSWTDKVQADRAEYDFATFEGGKSTRTGLEFYLAAFPDGEFVVQAHARLQAIAKIEARKREEAARAAQLEQERQRRVEELRRTWVTRFFGFWARTLLGLENWGAPVADVAKRNREFSLAFGRAPRPRCTTDECVKYYTSSYAVPVPGGTRIERSMQLILRLRLGKGRRVERAELLMPSWGFSRWREVEERTLVVDSDPDSRRAAIDWALARWMPLLEELVEHKRPLKDYELEPIPPPAIGPSGELTDTTAQDPSAPANRIQAEAGPGGPAQGVPQVGAAPVGGAAAAPAAGADAAPDIEAMVAAEAPEPEADMVMQTLTVDSKGRAAAGGAPAGPPAEAVPEQGHGGETMVFEPLAVPGEGAEAPTGGAVEGPAVTLEVVPPRVEAFAADGMRIVVFAAGSDAASPAYDGLVIERHWGRKSLRKARKK